MRGAAAAAAAVWVCACAWACCGGGAGGGYLERLEQHRGPFALVLNSHLLKCEHSRSLELEVSGVRVYYYDFVRDHAFSFPLLEAADALLVSHLFDLTRPILLFVPGYHTSIDGESARTVRDALHHLPRWRLLVVDHSAYTSGAGYVESYEKAVRYAYYIGEGVAQMLTRLVDGGVRARDVRCVGHSLGAQVLGVVGELVARNAGERIGRITALDPAGPCFSNGPLENQVRAGAAEYVEVYHCNAGQLGSASVLGDVDFFANGRGVLQPQCSRSALHDALAPARTARCSHEACVALWASTVNHRRHYPATRCREPDGGGGAACAVTALAGFWNPGNATGVYYFRTDDYSRTDGYFHSDSHESDYA